MTGLVAASIVCFMAGCGGRVAGRRIEGGAYVGPVDRVVLKHSLAMGSVDDQKLYGRYLADMIDDFNAMAERPVLRFEPDPALADGSVLVSEDLFASTRNLGEGGPVDYSSTGLFAEGGGLAVGRSVERSIKLVFDRGTFFDGFLDWDSRGRGGDFSDDRRARILFLHEVGHGLTMDHDDGDERSIMFPKFTWWWDKDYDGYFRRVRHYFDEFGPR
jgi:hypothetical protein